MQRRAAPSQASLFAEEKRAVRSGCVPLAERMRPRELSQFVGQSHLLGPGRLLRELIEGQRLHSSILWGPPGSGKTTLAHLIASSSGAYCISFSAVLSGVKELRAVIEEAERQRAHHQRASVLVVDEIHRFNKAQQDAFLPHVEDGTIVLVGATTENPSFEIIAPLLSRASVLVLEPLGEADLALIISRALEDREHGLGERGLSIVPEGQAFLIEQAQGDARSALNTLEAAADVAARRQVTVLDLPLLEEASQRRAVRYDKKGDEHYNVISAFIKSMRGSDPDAAVYWLMRMIEAGEDPLFIARRMVIFAAEDVGNADPQALALAVAAKDAFHFIGLPEGRIPLTQAALYLASAPKSNSTITAMGAATDDVRRLGALPVPLHLRNAPTPLMKGLGYGRDYQYAHDQKEQVVTHDHLPDALQGRRYYNPSTSGIESVIGERLRNWARLRHGDTDGFEESSGQGAKGKKG